MPLSYPTINCPQIRARRTRDICIEPMFEDFTSTLINASAGCRVRESKIQFYVAGRRVNVLLASSGCAPHCTRRPAPGVLLFRISRTRGFSRQFIFLELKTHFWLCPNFKFCPQKPRFYSMFCSMVGFDGANVSDCFGCADRHHVGVCRIGTRQTSGWLMRSTQKCGRSPHSYSARFSTHIIWFSRNQ